MRRFTRPRSGFYAAAWCIAATAPHNFGQTTQPQPPVIKPPAAGARVVSGTAADTQHLIVVTISTPDGVLLGKSEPVLPTVQSDEFQAGFLYQLQAGDVAQAWVILDGKEVSHSNPVIVGAATTRVTQSVTVAKFGAVRLAAIPKEGQTNILVDTPDMPAGGLGSCSTASAAAASSSSASGPPLICLRVYVNEEPARLIVDSKNTEGDSVPVDVSETTGIQLKTALDAGECVTAVAFQYGHPPAKLTQDDLTCVADQLPTALVPADADFAASIPTLSSPRFDFGRVRGYFAGGSLFSFDNGSFSQPSIFMAFNLTKNWMWGGPYRRAGDVKQHYKRAMFETFFEARLTSLPVAACSTPTTIQGVSTICASTVDTFVSSRKAATLAAGTVLPIILTTWNYQHQPYGLSLGPLATIGLDTPLSSSVQTGTMPANENQFYTNFGFGTRIGVYKMSYSTDVAPESIMYFDAVSGRFSNFDVPPASPDLRYNRPWRFGFEGIMKVPNTPFILGFSANIHQNFGLGNSHTVGDGRDDLRFLFGAKFDAGKLLGKMPGIQ